MRKELRHELEVATSADSIWAVYGSPDIPRLLRDVLLPGVFEKLDVIQGNGGVGTVLDIAFPPGAVPRTYKEKFVKVDHKNRLKEVVMIEGGYLDLGCTFYMDRIHVLPNGPNTCVIKSTLIYEVPDELAYSVASLISVEPLASMAEVVSGYVLRQRKMTTNQILKKELTTEMEVATSADSIWAVYGSPDIPRLLRDVLLPGVFEKLDVIEGNGGVGTVLDIAFPPGAVPRFYKEKFVKVDHNNRLKEVVMIEGGYLDLGCTFYMDRIHVIPKGPNSCIIKSTLIYEVPTELADSVSSLISIEPLESMAAVISSYVLSHRKMSTKKMFRKELTTQMEVGTSADSIWAVYGSPDIPRLLRDVLLPGVFEKLEVIERNGGVGTVLDIAFPPGAVPRSYKEKFVKVDHENRLKEVVMIEGGYLDLGCTFYMDRIHVLPRGVNSCLIKSTLIYEVPDELVDSVGSLMSTEPLASMAAVISDYVLKKRKMTTNKILRKELTTEMEVATSADSIWAVYGSPDIPRLLRDVLLPGVFEKLDVIEGNGGVGTVLDIAFPPGAVPRTYKEKFVKVDHKNRLKEVEMIEGGYLDLGCTFYMDRIHVIPKGSSSCVIKSTLIYEVPSELADSVNSLISVEPLESMAAVISNYVFSQRKMATKKIMRRELTTQMEVATSADSIWAVYGSPDIPRLLRDVLLPGVFEKLDVVEGNGGVGTVLDIAFPPGAVPRSYKEKFVKVDHKNRLKEVVMIEGGYLDLGCTFYMDRIHVLPKGANSCLIKSTLIYEIPDELVDSVGSLMSTEPLASMAAVISDYVLKKRKMTTKKISRKELKTEMEVATSADSIWAVYGSPDIPRLLRDVLLPGVFEKLDVIEGNGGVGTVLDIAFPPGAVPRSYKEKFVKVDHKNRLKEVVMIEGGYLDLGCTFYMDRIHVLPKTLNSCVIKSTLIYEVPDEFADAVGSLISVEPLASMAEVISAYVLKQKKEAKKILRKELTHELEVPTSADSIWAVYGSPDIPRLLRDVLLPGVFEKLDVVVGNGGVGTVLDIAFPPGAVPRSYKEKFVKVDHDKHLKEVVMIEGGYLDLGCTFYMDRIHVLPKGPNSCVIESTLIYEVREELADVVGSLISIEPLASMAEVISNYVLKQQLRVFGVVVQPRVGLSLLLCLILCLVILGGLLIGGVSI